MGLIKLHVSNIYKGCRWHMETDAYKQINYSESPYAEGMIDEDILARLIKLNISLLWKLLDLPNYQNYDVESESLFIFGEMIKHVKINNQKIFGHSLEDFINDNKSSLISFLLELKFDSVIEKFKSVKPAAFAQYADFGKQIQASLEGGKYNECVRILLNVNNMCQDFAMHMILQIISLSIFLFMRLTRGSNPNNNYETNMDTIAIRRIMMAFQKLIIDQSRDLYYVRDALNVFSRRINIPKQISQSQNVEEIERYIFNRIISENKEIKNIYPSLAIKKQDVNQSERLDNIYHRWNRVSANTQASILLALGFRVGEDANIFPYILSLDSSYILRRKAFTKYIMHRVIKDHIPKDLKDDVNEFVKNFDEIWDHILLPDRENWVNVNKMTNPNSKTIICCNHFEDGQFSFPKLLKLLFTNPRMMKIFSNITAGK